MWAACKQLFFLPCLGQFLTPERGLVALTLSYFALLLLRMPPLVLVELNLEPPRHGSPDGAYFFGVLQAECFRVGESLRRALVRY